MALCRHSVRRDRWATCHKFAHVVSRIHSLTKKRRSRCMGACEFTTIVRRLKLASRRMILFCLIACDVDFAVAECIRTAHAWWYAPDEFRALPSFTSCLSFLPAEVFRIFDVFVSSLLSCTSLLARASCCLEFLVLCCYATHAVLIPRAQLSVFAAIHYMKFCR
jgi:hypothetical protein